ncbi:MAG: hypothetical protein KAH57_03710 [Thermoplasmata archaeon]|nr:hypothetical protein [Thermoplasmata archaeon]
MSLFFFGLALAIVPLLVAVIMALLVYAEYNKAFSFIDREFEEILEIRKKKRPQLIILISLMFVNVVYSLFLLLMISIMVPSPNGVQERAITIAMILMGSGAILSTIAMKWAITRVVKEIVPEPVVDHRGRTQKDIEKLRRENLFGSRVMEAVIPQTLATYGLMIAIMILMFSVDGSYGDANQTVHEGAEGPSINEDNIDDLEFVGILIAFSYIPSMVTGLIPKWIKGDPRNESVVIRKVVFGLMGSLPTVICFSIFVVEIVR